MSTATARRIETTTSAERDTLDILLRHPDGIRLQQLNPRSLKRRARAIEEWRAQGIVVDCGAHGDRVQVDAPWRNPDQTCDAWAREILPLIQALDAAADVMAAQQQARADAMAALPGIVDHPDGYEDGYRALRGVARRLTDERAMEDAMDAAWQLAVRRARAENAGQPWSDVVARAREMICALRDAAASITDVAPDPDADPLGGSS